MALEAVFDNVHEIANLDAGALVVRNHIRCTTTVLPALSFIFGGVRQVTPKKRRRNRRGTLGLAGSVELSRAPDSHDHLTCPAAHRAR
jgi:hypothetical protein